MLMDQIREIQKIKNIQLSDKPQGSVKNMHRRACCVRGFVFVLPWLGAWSFCQNGIGPTSNFKLQNSKLKILNDCRNQTVIWIDWKLWILGDNCYVINI